jgi:adenylosuccinate synthase
MAIQIIIGTQWGDEGKGRFVDLLSQDAAYVARFAGGDNAGHTIKIGETIHKLHLIPSGVIYPKTIGVLGSGMVINPAVFLQEIDQLRESGVRIDADRLMISNRAHMITPGHRLMDQVSEWKRGKNKIGTTGRGIGPAYTDKVKRTGIIFHDMLDEKRFSEKLRNNLEAINQEITEIDAFDALDIDSIIVDYLKMAEIIRPYIKTSEQILRAAMKNGQKILVEGAQGSLLDINHGSYPYVTSSSCLAANALLSLGIGMTKDFDVIGVTKAYQTRVGEGKFPTELFDENAAFLRGDGSKQWDEFGTTTGRPRRVGWLDAVLLREMVALNGVTELALTKLDVLSGLNEIKICTAYDNLAEGMDPILDCDEITPRYTNYQGWQEDLQGIRKWEDLPKAAQDYVRVIEELAGAKVRWISVGPERSQYIQCD